MKLLTVFLLPLFLGSVCADELHLSETPLGEEPDGFFVVDGTWTVVETDGGGRALEIAPVPLTESGTMFGETLKGGAEIAASFTADKRGRSVPRFAVGVHGISGYRLRLVPAEKKLELLYREERVADIPMTWQSGKTYRLELTVVQTNPTEDAPWKATGRAWIEGDEQRPAAPQIMHEADKITGKGKASIWATPYTGLPIRISSVRAEAK